MKFTTSQFKLLSKYCFEISKGFALVTVADQLFITTGSAIIRLVKIMFALFFSLVFLYQSLIFIKEVEYES